MLANEAVGESVDLSLVIACYDEEPHLRQSVAEVSETLAALPCSFELIFIDDCSRDRTPTLVAELAAEADNRRAAYHARNVGRGGSVAEGFRMARGRIVGFLDIDLEIPSGYIGVMLRAIEAGADAATARRVYEPGHDIASAVRTAASRVYAGLRTRLLRVPLRDTESGYKFFRRSAVLPLLDLALTTGWFWDTEIMVLAWLHGLKIREIDCPFVRRTDKRSTVRLVRDTRDYVVELGRFRRRVLEVRSDAGSRVRR